MMNDLPRESGPQPDAMLSSRQIGALWIWLAGAVALVLIVGVLLAISPPLHSIAQDDSRRGPLPTGVSTPQQAVMPAGRNTAAAPTQQNTTTTTTGTAGPAR